MGYFLFFINFIIISFFLAVILDKKIDITLFLSIAFISITEYLIGIFFNLLISRIFLYSFSIFCLIYLIYKCTKEKSIALIKKQLTPGLFLFILFYIFSLYTYGSRLITQHNELGNWALIVKNMYLTDSFPTYESNISTLGCAPITSLWHYWFMNFHNFFSDGNITLSSAILQFSIIIGLTSFIKCDNYFKNIFVSIIFVLFIYQISILAFSTTYADPILGLITIFSFTYIINLIDSNNIKKEFFPLVFIFTFLILTKDIAIIFYTALLIVTSIILFFKRKSLTKHSFKYLLLVFGIPLILKFIWTTYLINNNIIIAGDLTNLTLENIKELLIGKAPTYKYITIVEYINHLLFNPIFKIFNLNISTLLLFSISIIVMLISYKKNNNIKIIVFIFTVFCSTILFLVTLLFSYLFVFATWEATFLSALTRYLQTINIINISALLYIIFDNSKNKTLTIIILFLILFTTGTNRALSNFLDRNQRIQSTQEIRNKYISLEKYKHLFSKEDKLFVVSDYNEIDSYLENSYREIDTLTIRYILTPVNVFMHPFDFLTKEQILDKLNLDYTYIYFHNITDSVTEQYKFLLMENEEITNNSLFRIIEINNELKIKSM